MEFKCVETRTRKIARINTEEVKIVSSETCENGIYNEVHWYIVGTGCTDLLDMKTVKLTTQHGTWAFCSHQHFTVI